MIIAFSTGTSWGTYAVVFPVAMPLAWAVSPDPFFVTLCFGAVLGGSVFGTSARRSSTRPSCRRWRPAAT
ncbi:MAG: Na+/H+ antiporter NhaC family protein [Gammaproteobacteria bacterium]|nr:Na+/H+ antiporter NhaC family protein [Gammaproteobacteria bacterium]